MFNKSKLALTALALGLIAVPVLQATAQEAKTQTQTRVYSYDSNKDGYIQPDEFTTYLYTKSDTDGDGYMGDEEWTVTTSKLYRPYKDIDYNKYTYWDQDKDGRLDNNEVKTLIEKTGLYSKWDTNIDGKVSTAEFEIGTFNSYDDNNDGQLNLQEWKSVIR
jgi:Ca2+-binding EF-hand superfamily protein